MSEKISPELAKSIHENICEDFTQRIHRWEI